MTTPQLDDSRYFQSVHRLGRITVFMALTCFIGLAFALSFLQNIPFDVGTALQNGVPLLLTFSISGIIENLSFAPIIGCAALYMACVTGNVSNMKAPAAMNAMEVSGAQPGTPKGDVISMIAVASSTFVTVTVVFLGMLFLAPLFAPLYDNPFLQPAFKNMVPALFGALLFPQVFKSPKQAAIALILPILLRLIVGPAFWGKNSSYLMVIVIFVTGWASVQLYKRGWLK